MNPQIATLARGLRGTAWHSLLVAHDQDIRKWREAGESYRRISILLGEQGLCISHSAIHAYVRVRALSKRSMYKLPETTLCLQAEGDIRKKSSNTDRSNNVDSVEGGSNHKKEKFIFRPLKPTHISISDEQLAFNDPSNLT